MPEVDLLFRKVPNCLSGKRKIFLIFLMIIVQKLYFKARFENHDFSLRFREDSGRIGGNAGFISKEPDRR
jgi:hypothetical protein